MKSYKNIILSFILSLVSIYMFKVDIFIKVVIFLLIDIFYFYIIKNIEIDKRKFIICFILSLIYSSLNALGYIFYNKLELLEVILMSISNCIFYFMLCLFLMSKLFIPKSKDDKLYKFKHFKIVIVVILFFCSLPTLVASFPGVFNYDVPFQVSQFLTLKFSNIQPFLVSVFFYSILSLGKIIFSSYEGGLFLFIIIQMLICYYIVSVLVEYLKSKKVNSFVLILIILFYGLFPINHLFIVNSSKDTLFSYFFLLFTIYNVKMIEDPKLFFKSNKNLIKYILFCLIILFYRNNIIYVWIITILVYIFVFRNYHRQFRIILIATILPYFIVCYPLYTVLDVSNFTTREMMSIPAQSISRIYLKHTEELKNEDISKINYYFGSKNVKLLKARYRLYNSDNTKFSIDYEKLASNTSDFIYLFISLSMRYPKEFFETCIYNTIGYWYPSFEYRNNYFKPQKYIEYNNSKKTPIKIKRYNFIPSLSDYYLKLGESDDNINYLGIFKFLGNIGFIVWCYLFFIFYSIYKKKYKILLMLLPFILVLLTNLLGPVVLFRYIYYLLVAMPLFVVLILDRDN